MSTRRSLLTLALAAFVSLAVASAARAAVPSPATSTVDPCLRVCPAGDMVFHVVVRDALAIPIGGSLVVLDLCQCPGVVLCPLNGSEPYAIVSGCTVTMMTNGAGVADIPIRAGGTCIGVPIPVRADGVLLATLSAVSSPDQNGDAVVDATDSAILAAKIGGAYDPTGDLNCSAALGPGDQTVLSAHLGHACSAVVPVRPDTWGRIKTLYR